MCCLFYLKTISTVTGRRVIHKHTHSQRHLTRSAELEHGGLRPGRHRRHYWLEVERVSRCTAAAVSESAHARTRRAVRTHLTRTRCTAALQLDGIKRGANAGNTVGILLISSVGLARSERPTSHIMRNGTNIYIHRFYKGF